MIFVKKSWNEIIVTLIYLSIFYVAGNAWFVGGFVISEILRKLFRAAGNAWFVGGCVISEKLRKIVPIKIGLSVDLTKLAGATVCCRKSGEVL